MTSLRELLTEEGFYQTTPNLNPLKPKHKLSPQTPEIIINSLPLDICNDRKSLDCSDNLHNSTTRNGSWSFHSITPRVGSVPETWKNSKSLMSPGSRTAGPPMDEVATRAVIAILSGYIGRYVKDDHFRKTVRDKCNSYLVRRRNGSGSDDEVLENMKLGMENIDKLVQDQGTKKEIKIKSLRNSIELLTIVASLNSKSKTSREGASTCGIPNSHISACAQLYLAIVYKLQKNKRICARHLLQVFCDSPFLARTYLLPDLWEHVFLPHLLHLKIWYAEELEALSASSECQGEREKKMKALSKVYGKKVDTGTALFALYYKQWLKVGGNEPPLPIVPLPSRPSRGSSRKMSSDSFVLHSSMNTNLYKEVFGPKIELKPTTLAEQNGLLTMRLGSGNDENLYGDEYNCSSLQKEDTMCLGRSSGGIDKNYAELRPGSQRLDYFPCFSCRSMLAESLVNSNYTSANASFRKETTVLSSEFVGAITTICSSDILSECEFAFRVIAKVWLNSHADPLIEEALSQSSVVEAILEVLLASSEDEILELAISVLAELVGRKDAIRQIILSLDPQLEIFVRLLRRTGLFLKAAVLLYLLKPQAKQLLSPEWVPLVVRVLEFGDKVLTLFTVQCNPQAAAIYFMNQLLTGFDEDKNLENARQVVSLGGLTLLMKRIEEGEVLERNNAALIIYRCIRAEGSCRNFLADNIKKSSLLELIVLGNRKNCSGCAFSVLAELLYLDRTTKILNFLRGLKDGWGGLNTMHILFIYLQRAPPEERPLVAVILLLLDIMEDPFKGTLYRAEAIEAIVAALNCQVCNDIIQEQSARALLLLAGHFSYTGESLMERTLLQQAGFQENCLEDSSYGKEIVVYDSAHKVVFALYKQLSSFVSLFLRTGIAFITTCYSKLLIGCMLLIRIKRTMKLKVGGEQQPLSCSIVEIIIY
ncbi:putative E3 ubiquitin-protein ligase LIN-2 [Spatholobus suberectus]|nr:putative E3 ubiquitin-protein ligase LIN-2 [Spatholobus suberectus]